MVVCYPLKVLVCVLAPRGRVFPDLAVFAVTTRASVERKDESEGERKRERESEKERARE